MGEIFHFLFIGLLFLNSFNANAQVNSIECSSDALKELSAQYIFIGEDHFDFLPVNFFKEVLPILKEQGFSVFFSEHIDSKHQSTLDITNFKNKDNSSLLRELSSSLGYYPEKYFEISNIVIENDLNLRALDYKDNSIGIFPGSNKWLALRDQQMFFTVQDYINKNPNKKILFFNGYSHSFDNENPEGESLYSLFKGYYSDKEILNIKFDYFDGNHISTQRFLLHRYSNEKINLNCASGSFIITEGANSNKENFKYYIFKDNELAFPSFSNNNSLIL